MTQERDWDYWVWGYCIGVMGDSVGGNDVVRVGVVEVVRKSIDVNE